MNSLLRLVAVAMLIASPLAALSQVAGVAPIPIESFVRNAEFEDVSLSPDGKMLAVVARQKSRANLAVIDLDTRKLNWVTNFDQYDVYGYQWLDSKRLTVSIVDTLDDASGNIRYRSHGYRAKNVVLVAGTGHLQPVPVSKAAQASPGLVVYRFGHSMYYANTDQLAEQVRALAHLGPAPVAWFCIDLVAVDDVDFSAAATLRVLHQELTAQGIRLVFSHVSDFVRAELDRSGITALVGADAFFAYLDEVVKAYQESKVG